MFVRMLMTACVIALTGPWATASAKDLDDDAVAKITRVLPKNWKVQLRSLDHDCVISIETTSMETEPSHYSDDIGTKTMPVLIEIQILPRYSRAMVKRIEDHNRPLAARLESERDPGRRAEIKAQMIPYPMYQDAQYDYVLLPPGRVPKDEKDFETLRDVLQKVTTGWVAVDKNVTPVKDLPGFFTYK